MSTLNATNDLSIEGWKELVENLIAKGEPCMLSMATIRPTGVEMKQLVSAADGVHPLYEAAKVAEVWRLNDERNKRLAQESEKNRKSIIEFLEDLEKDN